MIVFVWTEIKICVYYRLRLQSSSCGRSLSYLVGWKKGTVLLFGTNLVTRGTSAYTNPSDKAASGRFCKLRVYRTFLCSPKRRFKKVIVFAFFLLRRMLGQSTFEFLSENKLKPITLKSRRRERSERKRSFFVNWDSWREASILIHYAYLSSWNRTSVSSHN